MSLCCLQALPQEMGLKREALTSPWGMPTCTHSTTAPLGCHQSCCCAQDALSARTSVFLSDVETDSWPPDTVQQLAAQSDRWLVTRGEFGAHEFTADRGMSLVEPVKVTACHITEATG